jgi:tetratricopeptide (TPR) repeat protein
MRWTARLSRIANNDSRVCYTIYMPSIFGKFFKSESTAEPAPKPFDALYAQAAAAAANLDFNSAVPLYDQAIALDSLHAEAYYKRGNALKNLGRLDAAVASYDQAIEHKPDYAYAYCNRGVVQQSLGLTAAALSSYDQAIAYDPTDAMAHYNRALLLQDVSRWDEALAAYDRALTIDPGFSDAHYNRSLTSLFLGNFESGWREYEWRWHHAQRLSIGTPRDFQQPLWLGEDPIEGKRLLLYSEGGLGDTLQFCRYAKSCAALGATVLLEVQPPLVDLLTNLDGVSQVMATGSISPPFDYQCPLMSLPLAFKTTLDSIPAAAKYLNSDQVKGAQWHTRLGERKRPRIGLVWSGNPGNAIDRRRSIRLADMAQRLPREFEYFCLQKDVREEDRAALDSSSGIFSFDDDSLDFANTAALCECMDLVISVDTSIAHLSGALGRRTWLLLPQVPDWRWMRERDDSPWYPTMKLYRQKIAGNWNEVFAQLDADLRQEFRIG